MKYVLATAVLLLAGCSSAPEVAAGGPAAQPPEPTTPHVIQDGVGRPATVGVLIGSRLRDVRVGLRDLGLQVDVRHHVRCLPGVVLAQRPASGAKLERGGTVHLAVARAPAAATCIHPPGIAAGRALRAWALGDAPPPAFADRVRLLVANRPVRTLSDLEAADPERWTLPIAYAERTDVRILETLAAAPMRGTRVPPYFCLGRGPVLPADLFRRLPWSWTLVTRDAEVTACMDVAAVQVWADGDGRITDVNLLMGSP